MKRPLRTLLVFEDRAFEDIVLPVIERVLGDEGYATRIPERPLFTHGCKGDELKRVLRDHGSRADLVVIGADTQQRTPAQKRKAMATLVGGFVSPEQVVYALPQPSAEGWMQADLGALKRGIHEALGIAVTLPATTPPYPKKEEEAKRSLASILNHARIPMLRGGVEHGPAVMAHVDLAAHSSMEGFVRDLRHWLRQW